MLRLALDYVSVSIVSADYKGTLVTYTTLGGLTIHPWVVNFLQCIHAQICEN